MILSNHKMESILLLVLQYSFQLRYGLSKSIQRTFMTVFCQRNTDHMRSYSKKALEWTIAIKTLVSFIQFVTEISEQTSMKIISEYLLNETFFIFQIFDIRDEEGKITSHISDISTTIMRLGDHTRQHYWSRVSDTWLSNRLWDEERYFGGRTFSSTGDMVGASLSGLSLLRLRWESPLRVYKWRPWKDEEEGATLLAYFKSSNLCWKIWWDVGDIPVKKKIDAK